MFFHSHGGEEAQPMISQASLFPLLLPPSISALPPSEGGLRSSGQES